MPLVLGLDLGTTTITALALDVDSGAIVASETLANAAEIVSPQTSGRSEWDAERIAAAAFQALHRVADAVADRASELAGIGLTGQQHGVLLVDPSLKPEGPFINWQDRRAADISAGTGQTWLALARDRAGEDSRQATGCSLAAGYMGVTLFWMQSQGLIPRERTACFLVDYLAALLTGGRIVTDATSAASSGLFDVRSGRWHGPLIERLGLPQELFPPLAVGGEPQGGMAPQIAQSTGLPAGLPVCVGIGDNQASFYGSVAQLEASVLVNVGTGGQVAVFSDRFVYADNLETRPFPGGFLLVNAGLCGGRTYAVLEKFFRQAVAMNDAARPSGSLYEEMNRLAANVPRGAEGLRFSPLFTGTRQNPELRGSLEGISLENMTPAHITRALLEGMARLFQEGYGEIASVVGDKTKRRLIGAGNGLRENGVLANCVADAFEMPIEVPKHREEAAFGAALLAAVKLGVLHDRAAASRLIQYERPRMAP